MNTLNIINALKKLADPKVAVQSQRFFKSKLGEYGFGDQFLGLRMPVLRKAVKFYTDTTLTAIKKLLKSEFHEIRLFALLLLVHQFSKADEAQQEKIFNLYISNTKAINNWNLVDSSAPYIEGPYLFKKDR